MPNEKPLEEKILKESTRLGPDDQFAFRCGKDLDCFTCCCQDVSIVLTPYDVLRMKRALGISSSEFLNKYTISPFTKEQEIPVVLLKMDPESKRCLFVDEQGCSIYTNRPWACRMYPLGVADPRNPTEKDHRFHFLMKEEICHGHGGDRLITVREWIDSEGIEEYDMMGVGFKELMVHEFWDQDKELTPEQMDMYFMACYDLDRFRRFVFETRFLELFEVDEARVEAIRMNDVELLEFAMLWLRFSLFKEKTLRLNQKSAEVRRKAAEFDATAGAADQERRAGTNG